MMPMMGRGRPMSVDKRAKLTGLVAGPDNSYANAMMPANPDEGGPPNLRDSGAHPDADRCAACEHLGDGVCGLYDYPVSESQVCDSFSDGMSEDPEAMEPSAGDEMY